MTNRFWFLLLALIPMNEAFLFPLPEVVDITDLDDAPSYIRLRRTDTDAPDYK